MYLPGLQVTGHEVPVPLGTSTAISCRFDMDFITLEWMHNGEIVATAVGQQVDLILNPVNDSIHNEQYSCKATTPYGFQQQNITVVVEGRE